jgi:hypothetical protein
MKQTLLYDPEVRATTKDMMAHQYFQHDNFGDNFEPKLRQTIEMEKEREQTERQRRKRSKKALFC